MRLTKRIEWVDIVKYICIMWVILCHLEADTELLSVFYTPFFLNGFFFVSGYVYFHKTGFKPFFIKKIKGLFVPWLFFSLFNILFSQILSFNEHSSLIDELKWNFLQIRGLGDGIWFVAALFIAFIPFYFFVGLYEKSAKQRTDNIVFILIAFILSILSNLYEIFMNPELLPWGTVKLPWHTEYIFVAMFWMFLGYLFRKEYEKVYDENVKIVSAAAVFLVFLVMIYLPFLMGYKLQGNIFSIIYSYLTAFLGVFVLIYVSKHITPNRYLLYIGQNTLICFALHGKIFSILQVIIRKVSGTLYAAVLSNMFTSSIFAIAFTIVISLILIIPIYIINKWFPFLIGRKSRKLML